MHSGPQACLNGSKHRRRLSLSCGSRTKTVCCSRQGINDVAWSHCGKYIATASDDMTLRLWNAGTGKCLRVLEGHTNYVFSCCFNGQDNMLVCSPEAALLLLLPCQLQCSVFCLRSCTTAGTYQMDLCKASQFASDPLIGYRQAGATTRP